MPMSLCTALAFFMCFYTLNAIYMLIFYKLNHVFRDIFCFNNALEKANDDDIDCLIFLNNCSAWSRISPRKYQRNFNNVESFFRFN